MYAQFIALLRNEVQSYLHKWVIEGHSINLGGVLVLLNERVQSAYYDHADQQRVDELFG